MSKKAVICNTQFSYLLLINGKITSLKCDLDIFKDLLIEAGYEIEETVRETCNLNPQSFCSKLEEKPCLIDETIHYFECPFNTRSLFEVE